MKTHVLIAVASILSAVLAVSVVGCADAILQNADTAPTGNAISRAGSYVKSANGNVVAAMPHADTTGRALLDQAKVNHGSAIEELEKAEASNRLAAEKIAAMAADNQRKADRLDQYSKQWIGDRTKHYAAWIIGIWVGVGIGGMLLKTFAGGFLGSIGGFLMKFLPFSNPFVFVGKWAESRRGGDNLAGINRYG